MKLNIVYLPKAAFAPVAGEEPTYEYLRTTDPLMPAEHGDLPLAKLSPVLQNNDVWALLPITSLSWHAVALPKGVGQNSPRLYTVLENLLEDRLLDEPGNLHLALSPSTYRNDSDAAMHWVAACNKAWLHSHLEAIKSAGLTVTRIVPEFAPTSAGMQVHVVGTVDQPLLVMTDQLLGGVLCLPFQAAALALLVREMDNTRSELQTMQNVLVEPTLADVAERLLPGGVQLQSRHARWLAAGSSDWDLAQFALASTGRTRTLKRVASAGREFLMSRRWRSARWAVLALLLSNLLGLNALAWKEKSAQKAQRLTVQNLLIQTFPHVKVVVDAPLQMQREVLALQQASGTATGFSLALALNAVGNLGLVNQTISAIGMIDGAIRFSGLTLTPQEVASLSAIASAHGISVTSGAEVVLFKQVTPKGATP